MLTKEEVQHIAKLARLDLTEEELAKFQTELSSIVEYIGTLSEVDTNGVEETAQVTGLVNRLREDEAEKCDDDTRQRLLDALPDKQDGYAKVKNVFE